MATITTNTIVTGHGIRHVGAFFQHFVAEIRTTWTRGNEQRAYRRMLECDEHILHDIGITRDDVRKAMAELSHR